MRLSPLSTKTSSRSGRKLAGCALALLSLPLLAQAAPPPPTSAGQLQQELEQRTRAPQPLPASPAPLAPAATETKAPAAQAETPRLDLKVLAFTGNTVFDAATLTQVSGLTLGSKVSLADLQAAAARITDHYRAAGYLVASAYVPAQEIRDGHITLGVLEGRLDGVSVNNQTRLSDKRVQRTLVHRLGQDKPLQTAAVNRDLLLLRQLPGVGDVQAALAPGQATGSTHLNADVTAAPRVQGQLSLDNHGNTYAGEYRLSGLVNVNNLARLGDQLGVSATLAQDNRLNGGRLSWDAPVGYDGLRLGAAAALTNYELGDDFADLDAHGKAQTLSLYASYPWILAPTTHVNVDASLESRQLEDFMLGNSIADKRIDALLLGLSGDFRDAAWGSAAVTAWRLGLSAGKLTLDHANELADSASGADRAGNYSKIDVGISREQALPPAGLSLYGALNAQLAGKNLDSSEKFFLGGPNAVRGYPQGEAGGDTGWLATLALHYQVRPSLRLRLFHDQGSVRVDQDPYVNGQDNSRSLGTTGVGFDGQWQKLTATLDVAWHGSEEAQTDDDHKPRIWGRLGWRF